MSEIKIRGPGEGIWHRVRPELLLPPEIWKAATGEKRLKGEFLDWFFAVRAEFLPRAERVFQGISRRAWSHWSEAEQLLFSMYLQLAADKLRQKRKEIR